MVNHATKIIIINRIKRCIKLCKKRKYKKADSALDSGIIVDVVINDKFLDGSPLLIKDPIMKPEYKLNFHDANKLLQKLNEQSAAGKIGIDNSVILCALDKIRLG